MIRSLLTAAVAAWIALAASCAAAADLVFSVTEGVTYYQTNKEIAARFQPLTDLLAKALKRPVRIVIVSPYNDVRAGLARQEYDLAFI
ncbi:MAG TPA: PhnD/SsuA/transferrin family substrate-binding protein, partial [Casimicrobiaceae bacterium]|nr:PhnD/SsuA/transferrin family substrate-binding protein [Casimicrobiaceae bacterium]